MELTYEYSELLSINHSWLSNVVATYKIIIKWKDLKADLECVYELTLNLNATVIPRLL